MLRGWTALHYSISDYILQLYLVSLKLTFAFISIKTEEQKMSIPYSKNKKCFTVGCTGNVLTIDLKQ